MGIYLKILDCEHVCILVSKTKRQIYGKRQTHSQSHRNLDKSIHPFLLLSCFNCPNFTLQTLPRTKHASILVKTDPPPFSEKPVAGEKYLPQRAKLTFNISSFEEIDEILGKYLPRLGLIIIFVKNTFYLLIKDQNMLTAIHCT